MSDTQLLKSIISQRLVSVYRPRDNLHSFVCDFRVCVVRSGANNRLVSSSSAGQSRFLRIYGILCDIKASLQPFCPCTCVDFIEARSRVDLLSKNARSKYRHNNFGGFYLKNFGFLGFLSCHKGSHRLQAARHRNCIRFRSWRHHRRPFSRVLNHLLPSIPCNPPVHKHNLCQCLVQQLQLDN